MRVRIAESFTASVLRLEPRERAAVKRAAFDFLVSPRSPGLRLHRLVHAEDRAWWSLRVNRDLRVMVHRGPDEAVLAWADHHDKAYAWAAHRTGPPPEGGEAVEVEREEPKARPPPSPAAARPVPLARAEPRAQPSEPPQAPGSPEPAPAAAPGSARRLRAWRRATAPLPAPGAEPRAGAAPPPLLHLLRFCREAGPAAPPTSGRAPEAPAARRGRAFASPAAWAAALLCLLAALGPLAAAARPDRALAIAFAAAGLGAALAALARGSLQRREACARRRVREACDAEAAPARDLCRALARLARGERALLPQAPPPEELREAFAAAEALERFLRLGAGEIRALAGREAGAGPGARAG